MEKSSGSSRTRPISTSNPSRPKILRKPGRTRRPRTGSPRDSATSFSAECFTEHQQLSDAARTIASQQVNPVIRRPTMSEKLRPYLFYDVAISICSTCYRRVDAKIVFEDGKVWMLKRCPQHGHQRVLVADDVDYYRRSREVFIKTPEQPMVYNTPVKYGCPYDCGLCPDHEQHSCLTLVEICDACNLTCPVCYAGSGQHRTEFRSLAQIESMLDCVVRNEKQPDVVQISGGEPT